MCKCVFQVKRPSRVNRNTQGKFTQGKRNQRRRKGSSQVKGGAEGEKMESLERSSFPTQTPAATQHMDLPEETQLHIVEKTNPNMVHAQTQTWHPGSRNMSTQTPVVHHSNQKTQTEEEGEKASIPPSDADESQPKEEEQKNPDQDSAQPPRRRKDSDGESPKPAGNLSEGTSCDLSHKQSEKGDDRKTYAKAVMGKSRSEKQADTETTKAKDQIPEPPQNLQ